MVFPFHVGIASGLSTVSSVLRDVKVQSSKQLPSTSWQSQLRTRWVTLHGSDLRVAMKLPYCYFIPRHESCCILEGCLEEEAHVLGELQGRKGADDGSRLFHLPCEGSFLNFLPLTPFGSNGLSWNINVASLGISKSKIVLIILFNTWPCRMLSQNLWIILSL